MPHPHVDAKQVAQAVQRLEAGELVAFPTETVYGLGANARDAGAVERIFALKGRPREHPVIVHLGRDADLGHWARDIPDAAHALIERFWPGPLTLILARAPDVLPQVTRGQDSVGLRCPDHPVAQAVLGALLARNPESGLAAPSANRFGRVSPTTARHVHDEFGDAVMILDGGPAVFGIESTILDLSRLDRLGPVLLRPGSISAAELGAVLGGAPRSADDAAPRASGSLAAHYAPAAQVRLVDASELDRAPLRCAVWSYSRAAPEGRAHWRFAPTDPVGYAHALYATLRAFDAEGVPEIWIEAPPATAAWSAVCDRLTRAAAGSGRRQD